MSETDKAIDRHFAKIIQQNLRNLGAKKDFVSKIGNERISSDEVESPAVYWFMNMFKQVHFVNPMTFLERNGTTKPIYPPLMRNEKRILNTRNPFSRLYAAWGDKFRSKYYEENTDKKGHDKHDALKALQSYVDRAEPPNITGSGSQPPEGYK